jgi:two-component system sensor histidine kinase EvgS
VPHSASKEEYSFEAFATLLRNDPKQILILLEEIERVHDEVLHKLEASNPSEAEFKSMVHLIKGGAQLLQAQNFIDQCQILERVGPLAARIESFKQLLQEQNGILHTYQSRYRHFL